MSMQGALVECVPNFSEGRDKQLIEKITRPIREADGVSLLDVDMGHDFNRTVVTMVGAPEDVLDTVIECTRIATELIDMREHSGEHSRMGAVDVVPFIPIQGISMDGCVALSERYAHAVSKDLDLPIYLYAEAARTPQRTRLPDIRRGQYEGMAEKVTSTEWKPDYGPAKFNPKMGVTATGARPILIAYNVNLDTDDKSKANSIAAKIRTSGSLVKDENGENVVGEDGKPLRKPGIFQALQAAGWMFDPTTAQVSMNLLDYNETGLHDVTEAIRIEAKKIDLSVTAGELVGLVPFNAIKSAGNFYNNDDDEINEASVVEKAISGLMLDKLGNFDPESCIIEWAIDGGSER